MKNNCFSIEVGQDVVLRPTGNNRRGWDGNPIPGLITKIARKYFYVRVNGYGWSNQRFLERTFPAMKEKEMLGTSSMRAKMLSTATRNMGK